MSAFSPNEFGHQSVKQGMSGWEVWAVQVALNGSQGKPNLVEDGVFGPATQSAVTVLQSRLRVKTDGIFGPATSAALCGRECDAVKGITPIGLAKAFCDGESSRQVICVSKQYDTTPPSRDFGPMQRNLPVASSQPAIRASFDIRHAATQEMEGRRAAFEHFSTFAAVKASAHPIERAWRMAILDYNWESAADAIARGHGDTWKYVERGTDKVRMLADRTPWVERETGGRLHTGWEWCDAYVESKAVYITSWSVS